MSNRKRINVSINPLHYQELERICKAYKFANVCEICTALLSVFIQTVNRAEQNGRQPVQTNEEMIQQMFAELEQWEPTPDPAIMYRRHISKQPDYNGQPETPGGSAQEPDGDSDSDGGQIGEDETQREDWNGTEDEDGSGYDD